MGRFESFLEQLAKAGIVPSVEQIELSDDVKKQMESFLGADPKELKRLEDEKVELEKRRSGQDSKISKQEERIRELEAQLGKQVTSTGDVSAQYQQMMADMKKQMDDTYGSKLTEVLGLLQQQTQKSEQLAAKVARQNAINSLTDEYPVLKDPKYQALVPETADEEVLRERAGLLTELYRQTQNHALEQIRSGHIPATAPPRIVPGKAETLERELENISRRRDSGQISPQQAKSEMLELNKQFFK